MRIQQHFLDKPIRYWMIILLLGVGGIYALLNIGRLEDPLFTIKSAVIVTHYPGASAQQVEEEVTLPLENALQRLPSLDNVSSISANGLSQITVNIHTSYLADQLPQIWDELRRRVDDATRQFPPGVQAPLVNDDFGDVYGYFFVIHGKDFTNSELRNYADQLRRDLVLVPGVAKVAVAGVEQEEIRIALSTAKMTAYGLTPQRVAELLSRNNSVANAGSVRVDSESIRFHSTGELQTLDDLASLPILPAGSPQNVHLRDIATLTHGVTDNPANLYFADGEAALAIGVSFAPGVNVIDVGDALSSKLARYQQDTPAGISLKVFYNQAHEVKQSVDGFILNFLMALAIVVGTLLLFMGLRSGLVIAASLALNVLGTLLIMNLFSLELQRISLGALIISLSMLVDNAIVVVEGVKIDHQRGQPLQQAMNRMIRRSALPLLGATVIAIIAFAPIGLSQDSTGEYCKSLFQVLLISLMLSWVTALTLTPVFIRWSEKRQPARQPVQQAAPYQGVVFRLYRQMLSSLLRFRLTTLTVMVALLAVSLYGFGLVKQNFFPSSSTPIFFTDLWLPYGTDIHYTAETAASIARFINQDPAVEATVTTVGQGALRFTLTYDGARQYSNFAQIMVRVKDARQLDALALQTEHFIQQHYPQVNERIKRIQFGSASDSAIALRVIGPDPEKLRHIASQLDAIFLADGTTFPVRNDWQERSKVIRPLYSALRGQELGIDKRDIDQALRMNFSGDAVGIFRDGSRLMPVMLYPADEERQDIDHIANIQLWSAALQRVVPLSNVVADFRLEWENPLIMRRDRMRVLTVQTDPDPAAGLTSAQIVARVKPQIDRLDLPAGYRLEWGGELESSRDAQRGLLSSLPVGFLAMFVITILMFNSLRDALAIWATVPLALIGVTCGFLITGIPFGFMALIGLLSLSGMLIRNGIVLVEEIRLLQQEKPLQQAIIDAATSRLRPILLTAFTTVLGLLPLLRDVFFQSMAVVIIFGLGFATVLTLLVLPVIYRCLHGREMKSE
ncbi:MULTISPECIES: efflux RND transporter permease subunit [Pantoea]|jgi:multidrug efflux pump subunit AcrB|uniref:Efflux RND transporter permease subunit n=1 Tax=Pantoea brenneri TaxID=472694 RepID=A0A7Y6NIA4_9GAMM|nr:MULTISPECIES: efflux RND transporter permease subunit [Pantoea]MBZ6397441.1 efflux RND transporter permease subunit [Pantoea sp.]MBZ6440629.1 efflux RND transporter permease subunit [Pantoea sp.]NUY44015.1 efflux RND transporter permease subunit [Pantoea brenneri]NUY51515.1 efflux RND transporter permease subunit [Pantoea brenneri]NUY61805.1 efflux RND transporter permease subunit [Pantoea brenneri]